jgi:hypothetical protein
VTVSALVRVSPWARALASLSAWASAKGSVTESPLEWATASA